MKRKLLYTLLFGTVIIATGCASGGGGGSGSAPPFTSPPASSPPSTPTPTPPANTNPTLVGTINPIVGAAGYAYAVANMFTADLAGNGTQDVVVASTESRGPGLMTSADSANWKNSKLSVFGWNNGQLVDQTSQWFHGTDNVIVGTSQVNFGNFNGNGRQSMFMAPFTDSIANNPTAQIFVNDGTSFTRYNIALPQSIDAADSAVFSANGVDNVLALGYPYSEIILGSPTNNFRAFALNNISGSAVAAGDFLGNGSTSFVVGDYGAPGLNARTNALFGLTITGGVPSVNLLSTLPTPIFNTAAYFDATGGSNVVRAIKYDFDGTGAASVFTIDMPNILSSRYQSAIQFLKNNGTGTFTDVTATTVSGYDMTKAASLTPTIVDLLNTGLLDIVLPSTNGTQILMQVSRGQYVASMANTVTNFQAAVNGLLAPGALDAQGHTTTVVQGPNNNLYLLDMVPLQIGNTSQKGLYLTQLTGNTVALNAQSAITAARTAWPWLTDAQLNTMIVASGQSYYGATIINDQALLSPVGSLGFGNRPISGYVAGIQFNGADSQLSAMDQLGRNFSVNLAPTHVSSWNNSFNLDSEHIDQHDLTSHTEYLVNGAVNNFGPLRMGVETRNQFNTIGNDPSQGPTIGAAPLNYTVGMPRMWNRSNWSGGMQYTTLNYNPWVAFGGSWGMIRQTGNFDTTVRYNENGFTAVVGGTYTTTQMTPGLISKVNDIYGVWGETGYRYTSDRLGDMGMYVGIKPVAVSGGVQANLPTGVDNAGHLMYTGKTLALQNQTTGYVRALWSQSIDKNTMYRLSGTAMSNGQYRIMNELRYSFD